jgi:hypothetical protein
MAHNLIYFENPRTAQQRKAPVGYSWTTLFFGPFPLLLRGEIVWFLVSLGMAVLSLNLSSVVLSFFVNRLYIRDLISQGFKARSVLHGEVADVVKQLKFKLPTLASAMIFETQVARR